MKSETSSNSDTPNDAAKTWRSAATSTFIHRRCEREIGQETARPDSGVSAPTLAALMAQNRQKAAREWHPGALMSKHPDGQNLQQPQSHATLQSRDDASPSTNEHRAEAPPSVRVAVIVVSDTRTLDTDRGGLLIEELLEAAGHEIASRQIVRDEIEAIKRAADDAIQSDAEAVILTGGSGIGPRDVTPEAVRPMLTRELPGFGEMFRVLSFEEIGAATMLSRALAGVAGRTLVFVLPGSTNAVRLALEKLIVPEIAHLVREVRPERRK